MKIANKNFKKNRKRKILKSSMLFVKKYLTIFIIIFFFLFLFACDNFGSQTGSFIINNLKTIATSFTPTTDLFDDGSEVSFVSYFFGMNSKKEQKISGFYLPSSQQNLSTSDEMLSYKFDGTITSIASGVVCSVGYTTSSEKYIEIEHAEGYRSRYIGLTFVGVSTGESISAKKSIGLSSSQNTVRVYLFQNDNLVKISEIEWKS